MAEAVIEIASYTKGDDRHGTPGHGNHNVYCHPYGGTLRGRWRNADMVGTPDETLAKLPDVPGQCVAIDVASRRIRIFDPLKGSRDLPKIRAAFNGMGINGAEPLEEISQDNLPAEKLAEWARWMEACVKLGNAVLMPGSPDIPEHAKIWTAPPAANGDGKAKGASKDG